MKSHERRQNDRIADIIESRSPAGPNDSVEGWHRMLINLLMQMNPFLREGRLITFQKMESNERFLFEKLYKTIVVPTDACAVYLPPSVRFQMLYKRGQGEPQPIPEHDPDNPPDSGIVLGCRREDSDAVVNALLAKPPFTPAVDVYHEGQLLAGYVYHTIDECIDAISSIFQTHLETNRN